MSNSQLVAQFVAWLDEHGIDYNAMSDGEQARMWFAFVSKRNGAIGGG